MNTNLQLTILAFLWFLLCWVGYTLYAYWRAKKTVCLALVLHIYREDWMRRMMQRENRMADVSSISGLERNASFFASSTLIVIAGIITLLGSMDRVVLLLQDMPFVEPTTRGVSELKVVLLALIFVYAFFTFSWCMRHYNFAAVILCAAPILGERNVTDTERQFYIRKLATILSMAADQFNYGLRAYYFGLAILAWFIGNWIFIIASACVVVILYFREFHSQILYSLVYQKDYLSEESAAAVHNVTAVSTDLKI